MCVYGCCHACILQHGHTDMTLTSELLWYSDLRSGWFSNNYTANIPTTSFQANITTHVNGFLVICPLGFNSLMLWKINKTHFSNAIYTKQEICQYF